jgi:chemotaxis signal transduction protein
MSDVRSQWLRFRLGASEYAIALDAVVEVTAARTPRLIPLVKRHIGGILNVGGEPLPAVHGHALVGGSDDGGTRARHALVLEDGPVRVGILVDQVSRIERDLDKADADESFDVATDDLPELDFVNWVRHDGQRVGLVDAERLLGLATELLTGVEGGRECQTAF